jgi:hypothetical protein
MRVACIGIGGQGRLNLRAVSRKATVVALCDVDRVALARALSFYPEARAYTDYRQLYEDASLFDAVVISTPDHTHCRLVCLALQQKKHSFCEKPLVSTPDELSLVQGDLNASSCVTCLGCQGVYSSKFTFLQNWLREARLGSLSEVMVWSDRPGDFWHPTRTRLSFAAQRESDIDWRTWLMSCPDEAFSQELHPMGWRYHSTYGTGAIGDMGAHLLALPVIAFHFHHALGVRVIRALGGGDARFSTSLELICTIEGGESATLRWYHGNYAPSDPLFESIRRAENGILLRYKRGTVYCPEWNTTNAFVAYDAGNVSRMFDNALLPDRPDIFETWVSACESNGYVDTNFRDFGLPLSRLLMPLIDADRGLLSRA